MRLSFTYTASSDTFNLNFTFNIYNLSVGINETNQISSGEEEEEDEEREDEGIHSGDGEDDDNDNDDLQMGKNREEINGNLLQSLSISNSLNSGLNMNLLFSSAATSSTAANPSDPQRAVDMASFLKDFMDMHNDQIKTEAVVKANTNNETRKISQSLVIHEEHSGNERRKECSSSFMDVSNESSDEENEEHSDFPPNSDKESSEKEYHFVGLTGKLLPLYQKPDM